MDLSNFASLINTPAILPELLVLGTIVVVVIADLVLPRSQSADFLGNTAVVGLALAIGGLWWQWGNLEQSSSFLGSFNSDKLSIVLRGIIALSALFTVLVSMRYLIRSASAVAEYLTILLTATMGGMFLAGADEMVMVFISLETLSISSYLLSGYAKRDPRSNEAALKYLLVGAASSAIFLYGMSLLYGLSGGKPV